MDKFIMLFNFGMKRRIKDSFIIGYGIIMPLFMIVILGYMASNYYTGENGISSYYYYVLVTTPLCTFLNAVTLIYVAREESTYKCGERFIIAPISKSSIVLSKIIPSTISISIFNVILIGICKVLFKVNFRGRFLEIIVLLAILAFMSCAMGTCIGLCTKDFMSVKNIISTPILMMGVLGGSFFPIGSLGKVMETISYISPVTWINKGIFVMLNDNSMKIYNISLILTLFIGILFTLASIKKFKKEAFL
jgi:ABC-2 type transport system permease protein